MTSGYRRVRSVLRGADGSVDTTFQVQNFGNGGGGLNAEWERFHDAWRGSTIGGGAFFGGAGFGGAGFGGAGFVNPGFGFGGTGFFPGGAVPPNLRQPGFRNGPGQQFGFGTGRPDAGRLDPDGANGFPDGRTRTPDRLFFNQAVPSPADRAP